MDDVTPARDEGLPAGSEALRAALEAAEPLVRLKVAVDVGDAIGTDTDVTVGAMAIATVDEVLVRLERFCADMRAAGIHVGLNHRCVICRVPWPCEATQTETAVNAFRAGVETGELLEEGATIEESLERCVELGYMEHTGVDSDGQQLYRLTDAGTAYVQAMGGAGGEPCSDPTG